MVLIFLRAHLILSRADDGRTTNPVTTQDGMERVRLSILQKI